MRVEDNDRNRTRCLCGTCPSRPRGAPVEERLFCARGASRGVVDVRGCACAMCPVWHEYQLLSPYWCDREETGPERLLVRRRRPGEDPLAYEAMLQVKQVAMSGRSAVASMGAGWSASGFLLDQLHFLPAQAAAFPLNSDEAVNTSVVLGPLARQPLALPSPVMVSALSYGAVSTPVKIIVARVSESLGVAYCTGEGGVLEEERGLARRTRILQYASGRFGVTEQLLQEAAAVEIRLGQGAYPGKGSFLPAGKM
ncbi:MAG: glutamate synthase-related protein, partial [Syntrophomonadaceae bacterium]|nr:glutamate synthase-related protein [Syntrophomonadaceae bacterium]